MSSLLKTTEKVSVNAQPTCCALTNMVGATGLVRTKRSEDGIAIVTNAVNSHFTSQTHT